MKRASACLFALMTFFSTSSEKQTLSDRQLQEGLLKALEQEKSEGFIVTINGNSTFHNALVAEIGSLCRSKYSDVKVADYDTADYELLIVGASISNGLFTVAYHLSKKLKTMDLFIGEVGINSAVYNEEQYIDQQLEKRRAATFAAMNILVNVSSLDDVASVMLSEINAGTFEPLRVIRDTNIQNTRERIKNLR